MGTQVVAPPVWLYKIQSLDLEGYIEPCYLQVRMSAAGRVTRIHPLAVSLSSPSKVGGQPGVLMHFGATVAIQTPPDTKEGPALQLCLQSSGEPVALGYLPAPSPAEIQQYGLSVAVARSSPAYRETSPPVTTLCAPSRAHLIWADSLASAGSIVVELLLSDRSTASRILEEAAIALSGIHPLSYWPTPSHQKARSYSADSSQPRQGTAPVPHERCFDICLADEQCSRKVLLEEPTGVPPGPPPQLNFTTQTVQEPSVSRIVVASPERVSHSTQSDNVTHQDLNVATIIDRDGSSVSLDAVSPGSDSPSSNVSLLSVHSPQESSQSQQPAPQQVPVSTTPESHLLVVVSKAFGLPQAHSRDSSPIHARYFYSLQVFREQEPFSPPLYSVLSAPVSPAAPELGATAEWPYPVRVPISGPTADLRDHIASLSLRFSMFIRVSRGVASDTTRPVTKELPTDRALTTHLFPLSLVAYSSTGLTGSLPVGNGITIEVDSSLSPPLPAIQPLTHVELRTTSQPSFSFSTATPSVCQKAPEPLFMADLRRRAQAALSSSPCTDLEANFRHDPNMTYEQALQNLRMQTTGGTLRSGRAPLVTPSELGLLSQYHMPF